jgi:hypothetical protein
VNAGERAECRLILVAQLAVHAGAIGHPSRAAMSVAIIGHQRSLPK